MRLRGNLIVLMFACWKIHVRETAEIGLQHNQHMFLISDPNIAMVQLLCHQKVKSSRSKGQNHPINLRGTLVAD